MPSRKTAVSIEEPLFDQAEKLAEQMRVSRSHLYALALEMFIERHKSQQLLEQLNRAYEESPLTAEESQLLDGMRGQQRRLVEDEP